MKIDKKPRISIMRARESIRPSRRGRRVSYIPREQILVSHAQRTAWDTEDILSEKGWCLWRCESLDNDIIAIARDDNAHEVPERYVAYTESELRQIFSHPMDRLTLRIIHGAKRCGILQPRHLTDGFSNNEECCREIASTNTNYGISLAMDMS